MDTPNQIRRGRPAGSTSAAPKYRLHKPTGQARVTLGGKDIYLGKFGTEASKREYDRIIGEWLVRGRLHATADSTITIDELLAARWVVVQAKAKPGGNGGMDSGTLIFRRIAKMLRREYADQPVNRFGPLALRTLRLAMQSERVRSRGDCKELWSRQYINTLCKAIREIFKWGVSFELVPQSTYDALCTVDELPYGTPGVRETEDVKPVDAWLVDGTLARTSPTVTDMIRLMRLTGMRPGEVCVMRACDIDMSGIAWFYRPHKHKLQHKGIPRVIPIVGDAQAIVRARLTTSTQAYLFSPAVAAQEGRDRRAANAKTDPARLVQKRAASLAHSRQKRGARPRVYRDHYSTGHFARAIRKAASLAFPPPATMTDPAELKAWEHDHSWHPNQLRHNAASVVATTAHGDDGVQKLLGHTSKRTGRAHYIEPNLEHLAKIASELASRSA